jgi:hypothetical protein
LPILFRSSGCFFLLSSISPPSSFWREERDATRQGKEKEESVYRLGEKRRARGKKRKKGGAREKTRGGNEWKLTERRERRRESEGTRERKGEKGEKEGGGEKERKGEEGKEGGKKEGRSLVLEDDVTARGRKRKGQ